MDYLLERTETKRPSNADLADLCLSDTMIELLKEGKIDTALLCELAEHSDFVKLMADIQIYVEVRWYNKFVTLSLGYMIKF